MMSHRMELCHDVSENGTVSHYDVSQSGIVS